MNGLLVPASIAQTTDSSIAPMETTPTSEPNADLNSAVNVEFSPEADSEVNPEAIAPLSQLAPNSPTTAEGSIEPSPAASDPALAVGTTDLHLTDLETVSTVAQDLTRTPPPEPLDPTPVAQGAYDPPAPEFEIYVGARNTFPNALYGATRSRMVPAASDIRAGLNLSGGVQYNLSEDDYLRLELRGGTSVLAGDLSYVYDPDASKLGFAVNVFNQRSYSNAFNEGDRDVELPGDDEPWVHRLGVGIAAFYDFNPDLEGTLGLTYQRVSVRDDVFSSDLYSRDEDGNPITFSNDGQDDLLTLNLAAQYDTRDSRSNPTMGTRVRAGIDQAIPIGDEDISFTRVAASVSQFIPLPLFGFADGPRTLVLNFQAGHIFGDDILPYEAFSLGGTNTVRGYSGGEVGTGRSFIEATAEYRFPIGTVNLFNEDIDLGGVLFVDYGDLLDTQDEVIGDPAIARDKDGDGLGYGVGVRAITPFGALRVEFALDDDGESELHLTLGERF
jgi:outer membrane protein insertion porin family